MSTERIPRAEGSTADTSLADPDCAIESGDAVESLGQRSLRHPRVDARLLTLLAIAMVAFSVTPIVNSVRGAKNKDYNLWYRTGQIVLHGGVIYPKDGHLFPFMYPPSCASMLAILSLPGEPAFVVLLTLINSAAWIASVLLAVYLATGRSVRQHPLLYLVPTVAVAAFVHDTYLLGQPNLLLLASMLGAFACLRTGRPWSAGVLVAFAAAVKAFPIMAVGYLVYRRYWKSVLSVVFSLAVLLLVLPLPFRQAERTWDDLKTWTLGMVLKYDSGTIAQRPERSYSYKNQSMIALANRMLRPVPADGEAKDPWSVSIADLDFRVVNGIIIASALGLCLFYVVVMPRTNRRTGQTDALETAMLLLLILAFSPLSFDYFYVWLLYPLTVALRLVLTAPKGSRDRKALEFWLIEVLGILALSIPFHRTAQAYGNLFFAGMLLLAGFGITLWRLGHDSSETGERDESPRQGQGQGHATLAGPHVERSTEVSRPGRRARRSWLLVLMFGLATSAVVSLISAYRYDVFEKNVAVVEPGRLIRGAWQRPIPLRRILAREKIKTIVTLAPIEYSNYRFLDQSSVVAETGVHWIFLPMDGSTATLEQMAEAADLLADPKLQPIFFHCIAGHHRTSLAHAAYRIRHDGWSAERAWRELERLRWTRPESDVRDRRLIEAFAAQRSIAPSRDHYAMKPEIVRR